MVDSNNETHQSNNEQLSSHLFDNIMHFARILRRAGIAVGTGQIVDAITAVVQVGIGNRDDFYWTLYSIFISKHDQEEIFEEAFHIFWRNPEILEKMMQMALPDLGSPDQRPKDQEISRRVSDAMSEKREDNLNQEEDEQLDYDASLTWSATESLGQKDFEKMSAEEISEAIDAIKRMNLPLTRVPTRRFCNSISGSRVDMRRTLRAASRSPDGYIPLKYKSKVFRRPPLVLICDISGSMERYSRMMLHFMHTVINDRDRVHTFLFGTRLSNVTRYLTYKDVDLALAKVGQEVRDWSGGTRIGNCLNEFNRSWSRRVLAQGAVVILISDGLDRDEAIGLDVEMDRLHKSSRRLIWLNPLLRYDGFEPKSMGIRSMLPHVDEFRTVHNLDSLRDLSMVLSN
ncbi:MAG: VWA domain-containing protein [Pseudomonadota bacterium]|nr:VWA domain-containing protein [Pseudomonadota bacterium]